MDMAKKTRRKQIKRRKGTLARQNRKKNRTIRRAARPRRYDSRLELGLKYIRQGDALAEAARKIGVKPSQLRSYIAATGIVTRKGGKWLFKRDRRFRRMPIYSDGKRAIITVHNGKTSSLIGSYMRGVRVFFATEDIHELDPFRNQSVPDVNGKRYVFETRPNVLLRLDAAGIEPFELAYEIVKRE
jgi:hypothetical protein